MEELRPMPIEIFRRFKKYYPNQMLAALYGGDKDMFSFDQYRELIVIYLGKPVDNETSLILSGLIGGLLKLRAEDRSDNVAIDILKAEETVQGCKRALFHHLIAHQYRLKGKLVGRRVYGKALEVLWDKLEEGAKPLEDIKKQILRDFIKGDFPAKALVVLQENTESGNPFVLSVQEYRELMVLVFDKIRYNKAVYAEVLLQLLDMLKETINVEGCDERSLSYYLTVFKYRLETFYKDTLEKINSRLSQGENIDDTEAKIEAQKQKSLLVDFYKDTLEKINSHLSQGENIDDTEAKIEAQKQEIRVYIDRNEPSKALTTLEENNQSTSQFIFSDDEYRKLMALCLVKSACDKQAAYAKVLAQLIRKLVEEGETVAEQVLTNNVEIFGQDKPLIFHLKIYSYELIENPDASQSEEDKEDEEYYRRGLCKLFHEGDETKLCKINSYEEVEEDNGEWRLFVDTLENILEKFPSIKKHVDESNNNIKKLVFKNYIEESRWQNILDLLKNKLSPFPLYSPEVLCELITLVVRRCNAKDEDNMVVWADILQNLLKRFLLKISVESFYDYKIRLLAIKEKMLVENVCSVGYSGDRVMFSKKDDKPMFRLLEEFSDELKNISKKKQAEEVSKFLGIIKGTINIFNEAIPLSKRIKERCKAMVLVMNSDFKDDVRIKILINLLRNVVSLATDNEETFKLTQQIILKHRVGGVLGFSILYHLRSYIRQLGDNSEDSRLGELKAMVTQLEQVCGEAIAREKHSQALKIFSFFEDKKREAYTFSFFLWSVLQCIIVKLLLWDPNISAVESIPAPAFPSLATR
ncbi:MAG: hypothetical protein V3V61_06090 [Gammaproteobacteria bacterium]